jgi:hypothetical protein
MITAVLLETLLLASLGGAVGAMAAWAIFDGFIASTVGANSSQMVFAIKVSPVILGSGLKGPWRSRSLEGYSQLSESPGCPLPAGCASCRMTPIDLSFCG